MTNIVYKKFIVCKLIFIVIFFIGCTNTMDSFAAEPICPSNIYRLDDKQLEENSTNGIRGNAKSAYRLYKYYSMLTKNKYMADAWLFISAKLGDEVSEYTFKLLCNDKKIIENRLFVLTEDQERDFLTKHDEFHIYCLYMHYEQSGDLPNAKIYLEQLKKMNISKLLLHAK